MDAFETVVSEILWRDGYWVQNSLKVDLTKEEKLAIGRPSGDGTGHSRVQRAAERTPRC